MTLPYADPLTVRAPAARVVPEPLRRGEPGGESCRIRTGQVRAGGWSDDTWTLHPPGDCALPGTIWLASRAHVDSFCDLPPAAAADFGPIAARVERAILSLGDIARVHLYRWGDGGAHFHVWFMPRRLGMLDAAGMMLSLWNDALPKAPDAELVAAAERVAAAMSADA
jgi:diadenosine tetraphosphate (Ap4A) HIT family hydrolase